MYCPRCGLDNPQKGKFCRSCGFKLEGVAQLLVIQKDENVWQVRQIDRALNFLLGSVVMASVLVVFAVVANKIMSRLDPVPGTLLVLLLAFALATAYMAYSDVGRKRVEGHRPAEPGALPQVGQTTRLLPESEREAVLSVAERTTELLGVETKGGAKRG